MKRVRYWQDTEPGSDQFNYGEQVSGDALLERFRVISAMGVYSGLTVYVDEFDALKVNVGAGEGYTPLGERIYADAPTTGGIPLVDYTEGAANYVTMRYLEAGSVPLIERFPPYTSHNTEFDDSYEIQIFDDVAWQELTSDQRRERLLVAIVTAQGAGVDLTQSNIQLPTVFDATLFVTQPSDITGVSILRITPTTFTGTDGALQYDASEKTLAWKPPLDTFSGPTVEIPTDGQYTLPSYTGNNSIVVQVVFGLLPTESINEQIEVSNLYDQEIARYSAVDEHHRSMLGSGTITPTNPHGMTLEDIGGETESFIIDHQDLMHANGILRGSNSSVLQCTIVNLGIDEISVTIPVSGDVYYVNGRKLFEVANNKVIFEDVGVGGPDQLYIIYVDQNGVVSKYLRAEHPQVPTVTGVRLVGLTSDLEDGSYSLEYDATNQTLAFGSGTPINVPTSGVYVLPIGVGTSYATVDVDIASLPISDESDTITVKDPLDEDSFFALASVNFVAAGGDLENLKDLRLFGTLAEKDLRDDQILERAQQQLRDLRSDGIVSGGLVFPNTGSNNTIDYPSLVGYISGIRISVIAGTLVLPAGTGTWYVYVNQEGNVLASDSQPTDVINLATVVATGGVLSANDITDTRILIGDLDDSLRDVSVATPGASIIGLNDAVDPTLFANKNVQKGIEALYNLIKIAEAGQEYYRIRTVAQYGGGNTIRLTAGRVNCGGDPRENTSNIVETLGSSIIEAGVAPTGDTIYYCYAVPDPVLTTQYKLRLSLTGPDNDRLHDFSAENFGIGRFVGSIRTNSSAQVQPFRRVNDSMFHGAQLIRQENANAPTATGNFAGIYGRTQAGNNQIILPVTAVGVYLIFETRARATADGEALNIRVAAGANGNTPTVAGASNFDEIPYDPVTKKGFDVLCATITDNPGGGVIRGGSADSSLCSLNDNQEIYVGAAYVITSGGSSVQIEFWASGWKEELD